MFGFSDDKPRTCLCGIPLTSLIAVFAVLGAIEAVFYMIQGNWWGAGMDVVYSGLALASILMKGNAMVRTVYFWYSAAGAVFGLVMSIILLFGGVE